MLRRWKDPSHKQPSATAEPPPTWLHKLMRCVPGLRMPAPASFLWRTPDEMIADPSLRFDLDNKDGKLYLGMAGPTMQKRGGVWVATEGTPLGVKDDRPAAVVVGSRGGKTRALMSALLGTWPGPAIVLDPKLSLADETAVLRSKKFNQRIVINAPFGVRNPACVPFLQPGNPLDWSFGLDDDARIMHALLLAEAIVLLNPRGEQHFDHKAIAIIAGMLGHLMTWPGYEGRRDFETFFYLAAHLMEDGDKDEGQPSTLEAEMAANEALSGFVAAAASMHWDTPERERGSVTSSVRRHLSFLQLPKIRRSLSSGGFDIRPSSMYDPVTTVYCGINVSGGTMNAGYLRMVLSMILAGYEAAADRDDFQHQTGRYSTLLVIDETYASIGGSTLKILDAAAGLASGFGLKLVTMWQGLGQAQQVFPNTWETFFNGTSWFWANQDLATLDYLEKRLGTTHVHHLSRSDPGYDAAVKGGASGASYSVTPHPVLTGREIAELFKREDLAARALVFTGEHQAMIVQRAHYDQHPQFKELFDAYR